MYIKSSRQPLVVHQPREAREEGQTHCGRGSKVEKWQEKELQATHARLNCSVGEFLFTPRGINYNDKKNT